MQDTSISKYLELGFTWNEVRKYLLFLAVSTGVKPSSVWISEFGKTDFKSSVISLYFLHINILMNQELPNSKT